MMFREKGKKVVCLRSEYVSDNKRTRAVQIASFDRWLSTAPAEVCQLLEPDEVDQLKEWLSKREKKQAVDSLKDSLSHIRYSVCRAAEALAVDEVAATMTADQGADLFDAITELRKALKRAGFQPRKQPKKQAVDSPDNQRSLGLNADG
jgi:predicted Zn-ribbon and HTH transcriptional regulator